MSTMQNTTANEPARKAKPEEYDLVILGGGTGGTIAAWTFAGQGQRVAVIERKYVGGSCPNIACLPSKNVIHSAKVASYFRLSEAFGIVMKLLAAVVLTVATAFAQTSDRLPVTDAEKIADALRAGPAFITKDATLLDWPAAPGGAYRVLRRGSNEWTCLPSIPGYPHDEPGCFDPVFLQWMQDSLAGRTPHIDRIGISYMYSGAWAKSGKGGEEFHVGPHLMIVSPNQDDFQGFNRDPSNGMPYVTHLPNRTELYLVMPVREWNEQHVHE